MGSEGFGGGSHGFSVGTDIAKEEYKGGAVENF